MGSLISPDDLPYRYRSSMHPRDQDVLEAELLEALRSNLQTAGHRLYYHRADAALKDGGHGLRVYVILESGSMTRIECSYEQMLAADSLDDLAVSLVIAAILTQ